MFRSSFADTIIAVSTPPGRGGIGIVRLSGPDALPISLTFFQPGRKPRRIPSHKAVLGKLLDPANGRSFDEAVLVYFQKPRSYTKEDVVEMSLHGSPVVLEEAVRLGVAAGARPARPGEFTLRACLNGRYDLIQAEAVNDLIRAESRAAAKMAWGQIEGGLSHKVLALRRELIELAADIEASLEFPDEDLPTSKSGIMDRISRIAADIETLVSSHETGKALVDGPVIAIIGRANVGKSTLFNAFLGEERAITAPEPGTTRDYLTERIRIKAQGFTLVDMAGLGRPASDIEKEGIRRGRKAAREADGLILLMDASKKAHSEDLALLSEYRGRKAVLVFNKIDLPRIMDVAAIRKNNPGFPSIGISALKGTNIGKLMDRIYDRFAPVIPDSGEIIFHERQKHLLEAVLSRLRAGEKALETGYSEEVCAEEVREALPLFGQLTGEIGAEEVIGDIFDRFCVGK
jgi:tRNA modification GTPase